MKTIGPKSTMASGNPRKAPAAPRKAPVAPSKTMAMAAARKQVASKGSARKSAVVGSSARKSTAFKNTARKQVVPTPQKSLHSARKSSVPTKSLSGKGAPKKTEKRARATKGKKRRRNPTPDDSDLSDESGYSALEDVTDTSDDDDDEIELAEEEHLAGLGETPGSYVSTEDDDDDLDEEDVNLLDDDDDVAIVDSDDDDNNHEDDDDRHDDDDLDDENDKDIANFTVNSKYASIENDDDEDDDDEEEEDDDDDDYDAELARELAKDDASVDGDIDENSSWNGVSEDEHPTGADATTGADSAVRKVRFDVPSSDSESTDTDEEVFDEFFPDIFVSQNNLDPTFKQELENDSDGSCSSESYWDFDSAPNEFPAADSGNVDADLDLDLDDVGIAFEMPIEIPGDMAFPTGAGDGQLALSGFPADFETSPEDGYESDGDTTEDDDEPMPIVRRKVHTQVHDTVTDSETERPVKARRGHPRAASFDLDRSDEKPIVVANPHSRKMMIFTPDNRPRAMEVSPEQFDIGDFNFFTSVTDTLPGAGSGLANDFGIFPGPGLFGNMATGNPFDSLLDPLFEAQEEELDSDELGEEDEGEKVLNIDDFIQLDDSDVEEDMLLSMTGFGDSAPSRPSTSGGEQTTDNNSLLNHLTPQTVGSFRRNQIDKQLLFSSQASQDSLSFSGPYHSMALKGIKTGRVETAGVVPLTPMRRRKPSQDFGGNAKDALSLSLGMGIPSKRKATSDLAAVVAAANGSGGGGTNSSSSNGNGAVVALSQKRQRSMSDITPAGINV